MCGHACRQHNSGSSLFTGLQLLGAAPVLALHVLLVHRVCYTSYGWAALWFSPGLAWCVPLLALLLANARRISRPCVGPEKKGC